MSKHQRTVCLGVDAEQLSRVLETTGGVMAPMDPFAMSGSPGKEYPAMPDGVDLRMVGLNDIAISPDRMRKLRPEVVEQLAELIKMQGVLHPIILKPRSEGGIGYMLIVGHHRLEAVRLLGHESIRAEIRTGLDADKALLAEIDENLMRAELSPAEEAIHIGERKALYERLHPETKHGAAPGAGKGHGKAVRKGAKLASFQDDVANQTGKSRRTVGRSGSRSKNIPRPVLTSVIGTSLDKGDQLDALAKTPAGEQKALAARAAAGEKVSAKIALKKLRRDDKERALAEATIAASAALGTKLYGLVYMDPASRFDVYSRETGLDRSADNHYPTEVWKEIAKRVPPLAEDGILACWTTRPQFWNTVRMIVQDWGLEYKTCQVWGKEGRGTGYSVIDNAEILIIAARGQPAWPAPGTQPLAYIKTGEEPWEKLFPPVIETPRGRHSEKPEIFAEQFGRLWPNTPKIEMYARRVRDGWDSWGNEAD